MHLPGSRPSVCSATVPNRVHRQAYNTCTVDVGRYFIPLVFTPQTSGTTRVSRPTKLSLGKMHCTVCWYPQELSAMVDEASLRVRGGISWIFMYCLQYRRT